MTHRMNALGTRLLLLLSLGALLCSFGLVPPPAEKAAPPQEQTANKRTQKRLLRLKQRLKKSQSRQQRQRLEAKLFRLEAQQGDGTNKVLSITGFVLGCVLVLNVAIAYLIPFYPIIASFLSSFLLIATISCSLSGLLLSIYNSDQFGGRIFAIIGLSLGIAFILYAIVFVSANFNI